MLFANASLVSCHHKINTSLGPWIFLSALSITGKHLWPLPFCVEKLLWLRMKLHALWERLWWLVLGISQLFLSFFSVPSELFLDYSLLYADIVKMLYAHVVSSYYCKLGLYTCMSVFQWIHVIDHTVLFVSTTPYFGNKNDCCSRFFGYIWLHLVRLNQVYWMFTVLFQH